MAFKFLILICFIPVFSSLTHDKIFQSFNLIFISGINVTKRYLLNNMFSLPICFSLIQLDDIGFESFQMHPEKPAIYMVHI